MTDEVLTPNRFTSEFTKVGNISLNAATIVAYNSGQRDIPRQRVLAQSGDLMAKVALKSQAEFNRGLGRNKLGRA